jgi:hypothetical protein
MDVLQIATSTSRRGGEHVFHLNIKHQAKLELLCPHTHIHIQPFDGIFPTVH